MGETMKGKWRAGAVFLAVGLILMVAPASAESWKEFQITDTAELWENLGDASGNIVVWSVGGDIMAAEIADANEFEVFVVADSEDSDTSPRVSGRNVVWVRSVEGEGDIMAGVVRDITSSTGETTKRVSSFAVTTDSTIDDRYPDIDGEWVTWIQRGINAPGDNIACAKLANGSVASTHIVAETDDMLSSPRISGELVVWYEDNSCDALGVDISDPQNPVPFEVGLPTQICGGRELYIRIDGQWVVWVGRNGSSEYTLYADNIFDPYLWLPLTQLLTQADVADNIVVWTEMREGRTSVYGYNLTTATEFRITDEAASPAYPVISADRKRDRFIVAWQDNRSGWTDLYGMILDGPLVAGCASHLAADLNRDCFVDGLDFALFAEQWLTSYRLDTQEADDEDDTGQDDTEPIRSR